MSVYGATGRRFRMKQERQLVDRILRALPSPTHSSFAGSSLRAQGSLATLPSRVLGMAHRFGSKSVRLGPGDDAAILSPSGKTDWVLSCDAFIENLHFHPKLHPPGSVGYKSLARATSDLAAMGAAPRYFLLTLALPKPLTGSWLADFLKGTARASRQLGIFIIGGDTTAGPIVAISITVLGEVPQGKAILRSGAKAGDLIFVSGRLGRAQFGLDLVLAGRALDPKLRASIQPHLYPKIQIELGAWLAKNRLATAMMDISDGLSTDLARLCSASGVGAIVYADKIPCTEIPQSISKQFRSRKFDALKMALHGGEDYELLFTVSQRQARRLERAPNFRTLTAIGEITKSKKIMLIDPAGKESLLRPLGWDPF
jgi:thiamine-monophosphate kinase